MKNLHIWLGLVVIAVGLFIGNPVDLQPDPQPPPSPTPSPEPAPPEVYDSPNITPLKPLREVSNLGPILSDIDGQMPAGHVYKESDKITWGHETSHGIHSRIRHLFSQNVSYNPDGTTETTYDGEWVDDEFGNQLFKSDSGINGFYILEDRAIVIYEPNGTIDDVSRAVPQSLRGNTYQLYLIDQQKDWNDTPLYILDELTSYSNGAAVKLDLDITNRAETVTYMLEFIVYSLCVPMSTDDSDAQLKNYIRYATDRAMQLYQDNKEKYGVIPKQEEYLQIMRTSEDAQLFRDFVKNYLGENWSQTVLGI